MWSLQPFSTIALVDLPTSSYMKASGIRVVVPSGSARFFSLHESSQATFYSLLVLCLLSHIAHSGVFTSVLEECVTMVEHACM